MYLIPRVIGIGIYTLILAVLSCIIMRSSLRQNQRTIYAYWILVGLMGYFFVPPSGFDLTRLIPRMNYYADFSFPSLLNNLSGTLNPGERIYYWIIGRFGNDHLLPCISGLISFGFCFGILQDIMRKGFHLTKEIALALILFMSRGAIIMAISNIRTFMAISIITWCVYQEMVNGKHAAKHWLLYIVACSMHALGYILTILRVAFFLFERAKNPRKLLGRAAIVAGMLVFSFIFLNSYWQSLFAKMTRYFEESREGTSYSYIWEGVLCAITIFTVFYFISCITKYKKYSGCITEPGYDGLCRFTKLVAWTTVGAGFIEFNTYLRLGYFLTVLLIPVSLYAMGLARQCGRGIRLRNRIYLICLVIFALAATRGYLCSLKFFE